MRPTRVEINLTKLDKNIQKIKSLLKPDTELMAVVKAMPMVWYCSLTKQV